MFKHSLHVMAQDSAHVSDIASDAKSRNLLNLVIKLINPINYFSKRLQHIDYKNQISLPHLIQVKRNCKLHICFDTNSEELKNKIKKIVLVNLIICNQIM